MRGVEPLTPSPGIEPANRVVDPADADPAPLEEPKASRIARYRRSGQPILGRLQLQCQLLVPGGGIAVGMIADADGRAEGDECLGE